ncbi:phytosulfokines 5-like isoform X2 [Panicum virgatum]|uniref:Phytosulfokine n=1 Tax=Panicum virgatum TaxID=38727 RepID=A0A8T0U1F5_PANVG|nr:phytosulfokines 5-like isoform X2 [Panicum virgatum]KAG2614866.1 hypothetical protein PVAP13_3NG014300 [Panicum virgatum]
MRRSSNTSAPLAAVVLLLFLFLMVCFFHRAAAARLLPAAVAPLVHQGNGAKVAAVDNGLVVLQDGAAVTGGDELSSVSEARAEEMTMMGAEVAEEPATECEEGNDDCLQRRLLRDAHLDYIYTQHKGSKP